ncbi:two-component system response regulator VicR [Symbiobacterium terraclitae]|uniref:Stage 0 sporulation protein A homolog n=1 Tax=Symbiobacterium terraclitae TaxID=557451 RepID=A0ABS4JX46_9FIRM|nr:winged helix-turn-helix domain-containing protein [Symbiobacterium terraclitae]MBP2019471.1 two-component system response regulator VicR [Symbiobacterium terraclitae]
MADRILVVDDERPIAEILKFSFEREGFEVEMAFDGEEAVAKARASQFHLVILDIMLPKLDGFSVCREIRSFSSVPILMLTAKEAEIDKVLGLELGADDYVTKPFSPRELIARVRAILRRTRSAESQGIHRGSSDEILREGDITINLTSYEVHKGDRPLELTPREFELLRFLVSHAGQVFSREALLEEVWGYDYYGDVRTVDVTVRRLREKLEENSARPEYIKTRRGVGYYFQRFA